MAQLCMADAMRSDVFNSMYGGFVSGSALPPPIENTAIWWDKKKIKDALTPRYLEKHLPEAFRKKLQEPVDSSDALSEYTYSDWIFAKSGKVFLILDTLRIPEKIFDFIDESWCDDDLPLTAQELSRVSVLAGSAYLQKRFAEVQYRFLVRDLEPGEHKDYDEEEQVPILIISAPGGKKIGLEKTYFPRRREVYYSRRCIPLIEEEKEFNKRYSWPTNAPRPPPPTTPTKEGTPLAIARKEFMKEIGLMKSLIHPHICSVYASYFHRGHGYILYTPLIEYTLKTFLFWQPQKFREMPRVRQKPLILAWIPQLFSALSFLHEHNIIHDDLRPSGIIIHSDHTLRLTDIGNLPRLLPALNTVSEITAEKAEYAPPERLADVAVHVSPEKALVFTACAIATEILGFHAKLKPTERQAHFKSLRAKRKHPTGSATAFGSNIDAVNSWIDRLSDRAERKHEEAVEIVCEALRCGLRAESNVRQGLRHVAEMVEMVYEEKRMERSRRLAEFQGWPGSGRESGSSGSGESDGGEEELEEVMEDLRLGEEMREGTKKGRWGWSLRGKKNTAFGSA